MSRKRLKFELRENASSLHTMVGQAIRNDTLLKRMRVYQEYPIPHTKYHVDWFILDLKIAIEAHGEQHSKPVAFDGDKIQAEENFKKQVKRDSLKKKLCEKQGWKLVEIWHYEDTKNIAGTILKALG